MRIFDLNELPDCDGEESGGDLHSQKPNSVRSITVSDISGFQPYGLGDFVVRADLGEAAVLADRNVEVGSTFKLSGVELNSPEMVRPITVSDVLEFQPNSVGKPVVRTELGEETVLADRNVEVGSSSRLSGGDFHSKEPIMASDFSGFMPYGLAKPAVRTDLGEETVLADRNVEVVSSSRLSGGEQMERGLSSSRGFREAQVVEKEEGECSDNEGSVDPFPHQVPGERESTCCSEFSLAVENNSSSVRSAEHSGGLNNFQGSSGFDSGSSSKISNSSRVLNGDGKADVSVNGWEESGLVSEVKVVQVSETRLPRTISNCRVEGPNSDQHKDAMLGKRRSEGTLLLNPEDAFQASSLNSSVKRQKFPKLVSSRLVKDVGTASQHPQYCREKTDQSINNGQKLNDELSDGDSPSESGALKSECSGSLNSKRPTKHWEPKNDLSAKITLHNVTSGKHSSNQRHIKNPKVSNRKTPLSSQSSEAGNRKSFLAMDRIPENKSVERLIREVTCEKFWHRADVKEFQSVPSQFESMEEYVKVFEPLLFEECRAQLHSTWEELCEMDSWDAHIMVFVKKIERRERGWYDVIVHPVNECKWTFKEGEVAVLSSSNPLSVRPRNYNTLSTKNDGEAKAGGHVVGTVRRYIPVDTRDPTGMYFHFYVGDQNDLSSKVDDGHVLRQLQPRGVWYLTVLGSLATTQREYVALHKFCQFKPQIQNAILQPSPQHFPNYEQQSPAMPECITPNFADHLQRSFNKSQLAAIQWAAMHTAAGSSGGVIKSRAPWPFTLVQGPPGTGKTHTVWGMLNVIHLVQYQRYYTSLLKTLAPESYKQTSRDAITGSIDDVLQNMDQNFCGNLRKLCPKPRMLVCAPSNAATDELLARVHDRGFIDGEMRVYRPDVARVGVDSQNSAAQAVSVERRTGQLLEKSCDEIFGWMHRLRGLEAQYSHEIAALRKRLNDAVVAVQTEGSVGVDPDVLVARDQSRDLLLQKLAEVVEQRHKVSVEMYRLKILEDKFHPGGNFKLEKARANLEESFAEEAEIVFTTVSSSGRRIFERLTHGFDVVVIDEAAQAGEVAVLPPLALGAARCVLVGDPQQLPATVISKTAGTLLYSRSLFERFQKAGCPAMLLSVQYRMHPQIRDFPSRYFYQGRLTDSESVANMPEEIYYKDPLLKPFLFFDITHGRESHRGASLSYQNIHEAQFCRCLYEHLQKTLKSLGLPKVTVGIITPYKLQLRCIQREFKDVLNSEERTGLYINTVDAFQGQERDVVILSCVRASNRGVGFVSDIRRMNVALTRARRALWVMGNASSLMQSDDWTALVTDAKARNCYVDMEALPEGFLVPKTPALKSVSGRISNNRTYRHDLLSHRPCDIRMNSQSEASTMKASRAHP